jgi:predicted dehydrogenase
MVNQAKQQLEYSGFPMARASLLAGKHTFIEKPMAASSGECEELIALAREKGLTLMVGHTFLFSPAVKKIRKLSKAATSEKFVTFARGG